MHCESISVSIDIYMGLRKLKKEIHYKTVVSNFFVTSDAVCFENVLPGMMKRIKFNCSFIFYLLLTIQHNV